MEEPRKRSRWLRVTIAGVLVVLLAGRWLADNTADRLWADSLGISSPHGGIAQLRLMMLALAFTAAAVWCVGNVYLFYRSIGSVHVPRRVGNIEFLEAVPRPYLLAGAVAVGLLLAVVVSHNAGNWWSVQTLVGEGGNTGTIDPILNRDIGYYLFVLPWYRTLHSFATMLTGTMLAVISLLYAGVGAIRWTRRRLQVSELARMHLSGLFAAFALALFWGYRLEPAEFVAGLHQVPLDTVLMEVRIPVARLLSVLALLAAGVSFAWLWFPSVGVMVGAWLVLGIVSLVGHHALPAFSLTVADRERGVPFDLEQASAEMERIAYGLDQRDSTIPPAGAYETRSLAAHRVQLRAGPVWDAFAVTASLNALADTRAHLRFQDANLGLYRGRQGQPVPVYLTAREIDLARARDAGTASWERVHVNPYSHTTGTVAIAAASVSSEGGLVYLPSVEPVDSLSTRPTDLRQASADVYFSPAAGEFAIVGAAPGEFVGVRAGGFAQRLALAWALQSPRLVSSDLLTPDALILWERQVGARLVRFAPFAEFGSAYPVVTGGRLYWVASGYVSAETFPVSRAVRWRGRTVRYLRAGLIGVVDAHSGATSVYLSPTPDPVSLAWSRRAPEIVRGFSRLAPEIAVHLRYPDELFETQVALIRGPLAAPPVASPALTARNRNSGMEQARRNRAFWWTGPWARDTTIRLRIVAPFEGGESASLSGVIQGTIIAGHPVLEVIRYAPALALIGPAEVAQRLADVRSPAVGVTGPRRTIPLADGVLSVQSTYATGEGAPRLGDVILQWGPIVTRGATLTVALDNALSTPDDGTGGGDWISARRWFERMEQARLRGDWTAFGRAYDALRRMLAGQ